jgi:hypothetical protein
MKCKEISNFRCTCSANKQTCNYMSFLNDRNTQQRRKEYLWK